MKRIITLYTIFLLNICTYSCVHDFEEMNTNPNLIDKVSPGTLLNPTIYGITSFNTSRADAFTFQLMQVALPFPSAAGGIHRYDLTEAAGNSTWNTYYRWLINIREMEMASIEAQDPNYEAIALTLKAWVYSLLSDSFGDVPFHEASRAEEGILRARFDLQQDVYEAILQDLERANLLYDLERNMIYGEDILFQNNVSKWKKFTNSLHLRLLLRISDKAETNAYSRMAQILDQPEIYPIFSSTDESAILKITGVAPNLSPWGRAIDFTTFRSMSEFFIDHLNALDDPRRARFSTQARELDGQTIIGYKGIPSGYNSNESAFNFQPSNHNIALVQVPMIGLIMTYSEVEFIKAELALKGHIASDAKTHYEAGVMAAMEQWGVQIPSNYFTNPSAAFDNTLERLMLQKYLGLYFNDYQQWFEHRRTGYPVLPKTAGMLNDQRMPVRFRYPVDVQLHNRANYNDAVARMGGDDINIKVWWQN